MVRSTARLAAGEYPPKVTADTKTMRSHSAVRSMTVWPSSLRAHIPGVLSPHVPHARQYETFFSQTLKRSASQPRPMEQPGRFPAEGRRGLGPVARAVDDERSHFVLCPSPDREPSFPDCGAVRLCRWPERKIKSEKIRDSRRRVKSRRDEPLYRACSLRFLSLRIRRNTGQPQAKKAAPYRACRVWVRRTLSEMPMRKTTTIAGSTGKKGAR